MTAWVGLGSNQDGPESQLCTALRYLDDSEGIHIRGVSGFYRSGAWGVKDQDDFVNAVASVDTVLAPQDLLSRLLGIETRMGRTRSGERWGPRRIDLDLLDYNGMRQDSEKLQVPHPRMHLRAFVLVPLLELSREFDIPGRGPAAVCLAALDDQSVERLGDANEFCNEAE